MVATLLAFAADLVAAQFTAEPARLVARQRIRRDRIDAVGTASIAQNGRLIAFVARDSSSRGSCCQHVYVLDRSTGEITQESISADGTPSQGDSQAPSLSADGRMVVFETIAPDLPPSGTTRRRVIVRDRPSGINADARERRRRSSRRRGRRACSEWRRPCGRVYLGCHEPRAGTRCQRAADRYLCVAARDREDYADQCRQPTAHNRRWAPVTLPV